MMTTTVGRMRRRKSDVTAEAEVVDTVIVTATGGSGETEVEAEAGAPNVRTGSPLPWTRSGIPRLHRRWSAVVH